jgi:hypothetical protein
VGSALPDDTWDCELIEALFVDNRSIFQWWSFIEHSVETPKMGVEKSAKQIIGVWREGMSGQIRSATETWARNSQTV